MASQRGRASARVAGAEHLERGETEELQQLAQALLG